MTMTGYGAIVVRLSTKFTHRHTKQFFEHPSPTEAGVEAQRLADLEGDAFVVYVPFSRFLPRPSAQKLANRPIVRYEALRPIRNRADYLRVNQEATHLAKLNAPSGSVEADFLGVLKILMRSWLRDEAESSAVEKPR